MYRAIHAPSHRFVAVKNIKIFEKEKRSQMLNELKALIDSPTVPGLVAFLGAFYIPEIGEISLVLEYMNGGSLADILQRGCPMPENVLARLLMDVLRGLRYLHEERRMVHRDIKPANILLDLNGGAKVSDFGISKYVDNTLAVCATFVGTVTYMSPERVDSQPYAFAADIWSLGLAILECATGHFPYTGFHGPVELMIMVTGDPPPLPEPGVLSPPLHDFLAQCLRKDPAQRPTAAQLLEHPFLRAACSREDASQYIHRFSYADKRLQEQAMSFIAHMYTVLEKSIDRIGAMYDPDAVLTLGSTAVRGQDRIGRALKKQFKSICGNDKAICSVLCVDCQPVGATGFLAVVQVSLSPEYAPSVVFKFQDTVVIKNVDAQMRLVNHIQQQLS